MNSTTFAQNAVKAIRNNKELGQLSAMESIDLAWTVTCTEDFAAREAWSIAERALINGQTPNMTKAEQDQLITDYRALDDGGAWERIITARNLIQQGQAQAVKLGFPEDSLDIAMSILNQRHVGSGLTIEMILEAR